MLDAYTVGFVGMLLLVAGWGFQAVRIVQERRSALSPRFEGLYFTGSVLLTLYALSLGDWIFTLLNFLAAVLASIGLYFHLFGNRPRAGTNKRR